MVGLTTHVQEVDDALAGTACDHVRVVLTAKPRTTDSRANLEQRGQTSGAHKAK
jgi:hypothetical protein